LFIVFYFFIEEDGMKSIWSHKSGLILALAWLLIPGLLLAGPKPKPKPTPTPKPAPKAVAKPAPKAVAKPAPVAAARPVAPRPKWAAQSATAPHAMAPRPVKRTYDPRPVPAKFQTMGVQHFPPRFERKQLMVERRHYEIVRPQRGPDGYVISQREYDRDTFYHDPYVHDHMAYIDGGNFAYDYPNETQPNRYYWHYDPQGFIYNHYYDSNGYHWYGFYIGDRYFFTRRYQDHWWWYDPAAGRWVFWNDGQWYAQDPNSSILYVNNGGNYLATDGTSANLNLNLGGGSNVNVHIGH
jgi:hypothetical protein